MYVTNNKLELTSYVPIYCILYNAVVMHKSTRRCAHVNLDDKLKTRIVLSILLISHTMMYCIHHSHPNSGLLKIPDVFPLKF